MRSILREHEVVTPFEREPQRTSWMRSEIAKQLANAGDDLNNSYAFREENLVFNQTFLALRWLCFMQLTFAVVYFIKR